LENQHLNSKNHVEFVILKKAAPKSLLGNLTKLVGGAYFHRTTKTNIFVRPIGPRYTDFIRKLLNQSNVKFEEVNY